MYAWKRDEFGHIVRAKARLVARGFSQQEGVDFFETYSPCPSVPCIRLLTAIACEMGLDLCHLDAERAFVQSELDEDLYIRFPKGCGALSGKVVKLGRSLYGLKQASRTWHHHLVRGLLALGFEQCAADMCIFRLIENGVVVIVLLIHVDDILCLGHKVRCDQFARDLNAYVPISNLGELTLYAGCRFSRDRVSGTIKISQPTVAAKIVDKFGVTRNKETPMVVGLRLDDFDPDAPNVSEPFRSLVGHLMWLANQTRPDILNAVRAIARYSHAPKLIHWKAALHVLMYVRFTLDFGITFQRGLSNGVTLDVFVDSDFANAATQRKSVSGGVVMCAGACVQYFSRTQRTVALSSTEAEYVALAEAFKEAIFLRYVWSFIFPDSDVGCTTVFEDNMGAVHLAKNPAITSNSKHIDIRHHFLRQRVADGEFQVIHVPSHLQHADFLTKPLPVSSFTFHRNFVMNIP